MATNTSKKWLKYLPLLSLILVAVLYSQAFFLKGITNNLNLLSDPGLAQWKLIALTVSTVFYALLALSPFVAILILMVHYKNGRFKHLK